MGKLILNQPPVMKVNMTEEKQTITVPTTELTYQKLPDYVITNFTTLAETCSLSLQIATE